MKFLFVYKHLLSKGGIPYETRAIIRALSSRGCEVLSFSDTDQSTRSAGVITTFARGSDAHPRQVFPYRVAVIWRHLSGSRGRDLTVVLVGCRRAEYLMVAAACRAFGHRLIIFTHGLKTAQLQKFGWGGRKKSLAERIKERVFSALIDNLVLRQADRVRALSFFEQDELCSIGIKRVFTFPDGIDEDWYSSKRRTRWRTEGKTKFLYLGRPEIYQKGLDLTFLACAEAAENHPLELILAGPDPEEFLDIARSTVGCVPPWVRVLGSVTGNAKVQLMRECDFFLHLSRFEGMAKAPREAIAAGLPLLATRESNFGDWAEIYQFGLTTSLSPSNIKQVIAAACEKSESELCHMSEAAHDFAQNHSWSKVAEMFLESERDSMSRDSRQ